VRSFGSDSIEFSFVEDSFGLCGGCVRGVDLTLLLDNGESSFHCKEMGDIVEEAFNHRSKSYGNVFFPR